MDEFSSEDVLSILAEALEPEPADKQPSPQAFIPLAFNEGRLLEVLCNVLPKYMHAADMQAVLAELRTELYSGIGVDSLRNLHSMTRNCKKCPLLAHPGELPIWNKTNPDCVFVAESSSGISGDALTFLSNKLAKVGFKSRHITLSYINRCKAKQRKHTPEEVANCTPYIYTELQLLKPKLIVPLGLIASNALLKCNLELGEERGRILWLGPWPVMPTWAPGYAVHGKGRIEEQFEQDLATAYNFVYGRSE